MTDTELELAQTKRDMGVQLDAIARELEELVPRERVLGA